MLHTKPLTMSWTSMTVSLPIRFQASWSHTSGFMKPVSAGNGTFITRHIKRIAQHGGLIGIGLWKGATCGDDVGKTVDAIESVKKLLGNVDSISVGSDFDGAVKTHFDASGMPLLTQALQSRDFTDQEIRQIMGENLRNFLLAHLP